MKNRPWTADEEAELIARRARGEKRASIAQEMGRTVTSIRSKVSEMRRHDWKPAPAIPSWEECHAAGMTAQQAAEARGMTVSAARKAAQCRKLQWAPRDPLDDPLSWESLAARGLTAIEAARAKGLSYAAAHAYAAATGLRFRPSRPPSKPKRRESHAQGNFPHPSYEGEATAMIELARNENRAMRRNMGMRA